MQEIMTMWGLQELDQELNKVKKCGLENEKLLKISQNELNLDDLKAALEHSSKIAQNNKKELRLHELNLQEVEDQKKQVQEQLYGGTISNNKELQKLENKLTALQGKKEKEESRIFELMELLEQEERNKVILEEELEEKVQSWQEAKKKHQSLQEKIEKRKRFVMQQRKKLLLELKPELQKKYEILQKKFNFFGITKLKGNVCQGCNLQMSSGFMANLYDTNKIVICENCHRILYISK